MAADTDVESCDDSVNSSDDTLEPTRSGRIHYRQATFQDLPAADVKVAFLNDSQNIGIELDLHPVKHQSIKQSPENSSASFPLIENGDSAFSKVIIEAFLYFLLVYFLNWHEIINT